MAIITTDHAPSILAYIFFVAGTDQHQRFISLPTTATTLGPVTNRVTAMHTISRRRLHLK